eukprot:g3104.t1
MGCVKSKALLGGQFRLGRDNAAARGIGNHAHSLSPDEDYPDPESLPRPDWFDEVGGWISLPEIRRLLARCRPLAHLTADERDLLLTSGFRLSKIFTPASPEESLSKSSQSQERPQPQHDNFDFAPPRGALYLVLRGTLELRKRGLLERRVSKGQSFGSLAGGPHGGASRGGPAAGKNESTASSDGGGGSPQERTTSQEEGNMIRVLPLNRSASPVSRDESSVSSSAGTCHEIVCLCTTAEDWGRLGLPVSNRRLDRQAVCGGPARHYRDSDLFRDLAERQPDEGSLSTGKATRKSPAEVEFIAKALRKNKVLSQYMQLDHEDHNTKDGAGVKVEDTLAWQLAQRAFRVPCVKDKVVCKEGDLDCEHFFVVSRGTFWLNSSGAAAGRGSVRRRSSRSSRSGTNRGKGGGKGKNSKSGTSATQEGKVERTLRPGDSFGELALLHRQPRQATVVCCSGRDDYAVDIASKRSMWRRSSASYSGENINKGDRSWSRRSAGGTAGNKEKEHKDHAGTAVDEGDVEVEMKERDPEDAELFVLHRSEFRALTAERDRLKRREIADIFAGVSVSFGKGLTEEEKHVIADALIFTEHRGPGTELIRLSETVEVLYLVVEGTLEKLTYLDEDAAVERKTITVPEGGGVLIGERAFLSGLPSREAISTRLPPAKGSSSNNSANNNASEITITARCYGLRRATLEMLLGTEDLWFLLEERRTKRLSLAQNSSALLQRASGRNSSADQLVRGQTESPRQAGAALSSPTSSPRRENSGQQHPYRSLEHCGLLGCGAFGAVTLVRHRQQFFALKRMSKGHIVASGLTESVVNEKRILGLLAPSPFIIDLVQTYKDGQNLYLLMSLACGGELAAAYEAHDLYGWVDLVRFHTACVVEALDFCHARHVIFRDLN